MTVEELREVFKATARKMQMTERSLHIRLLLDRWEAANTELSFIEFIPHYFAACKQDDMT